VSDPNFPIAGAHPLVWQGHGWMLLPERALWWEARQALLIADLHLGKEGFFQARGLPVPDGAGLSDLVRLSRLVAELGAAEVLILGDLVHGPGVWTPALMEALDQALPAARILIPGNHDPAHAPAPDALGFTVLPEGTLLEGVALRHAPSPPDGGVAMGQDRIANPELAGHLHPVYHLRGRGDALRLPCFVVSEQQLILPAFGSFTGGWPVEPSPDTAVYLAVQEEGTTDRERTGFVSRVPGPGPGPG